MEKFPSYENYKYIGKGSFGHVLSAYDKKNNRKVAIKRTQKKGKLLSKEIEIYRALGDCIYVVELYDVFFSFQDREFIIQNLVFEYVESKIFYFTRNQIYFILIACLNLFYF